MIIYFSATGNNKYVAERVAAVTGDRLVSISECVKTGGYALTLAENESLGLVTPTYFWGLPSIVADFLKRLEIRPNGKNYVWHVLTFGTVTGAAHSAMAKLLRAKGFALQGRFAVRMVDTWTPTFDLSDAEENRRVTEAAEPQIDAVIEKVQARAEGDFNRHKGFSAASGIAQAIYQQKRKTKGFTVSDACISCGLCARQCPVSAIEMRDSRPVWVKETCTTCLGCLHRCPKFAIQYCGQTEKHGQFVHPKVKL